MKKGLIIVAILFGLFSTSAQDKKPIKNIKRDTVKTEVIEVETKYNPKIADASKVKNNPEIKLLDRNRKKKLKYSIFSAPVASTFTPKSGVVKGVNVGKKEQIFNNFIAAGFGNYSSPYFEAYLHNNTRFESQFGLSTKYFGSLDNIENTVLNSSFSNFSANLYYKQEERYFDWKVSLTSENNKYNWYGIPENTFTSNAIEAIEEVQNYNFIKALGEIVFIDSYIQSTDISFSFFNDNFDSKELMFNFNAQLDLPLDYINYNFNNLTLKTGLEFLNGSFSKSYFSEEELKYSIFTAHINPKYNIVLDGLSIQLGAKFFASFDTENSANNFLIYPDVKIEKAIIKDNLNIFAGASGGLNTNTYKAFSDSNPFVSPTLAITQTSETYNAFGGFKGLIANKFSFTISGSLKEEEDKPLFVRNNSKSNGINTIVNGIALEGFEYGNSFNVVYDDVKTVSFLGELSYDFTKNFAIGSSFQIDNFTTTNETEAWNLPTLQSSFFGKYKNTKWFASTNVFFVGERNIVQYTNSLPNFNNNLTLDSFLDVNIDGGYHFSDQLSAFIKMNNLLNTNYQRFANFNVQGFQILGGITYKFDF